MEATVYEIIDNKPVKYSFAQLRQDPVSGDMVRLPRNIATRWNNGELAAWGLYRPVDERKEQEGFEVIDEEIAVEGGRVVRRNVFKAINPDDLLKEAKAKVLKWIDSLLVKVTGDVPHHEKLAWAEKNKSARAMKAGKAEPSQEVMLQSEAMQTGETIESLTDTIIAKADSYIQIIGITSGMRRSLFKKLEAADPKDYDKILTTAIATAEKQLASLREDA